MRYNPNANTSSTSLTQCPKLKVNLCTANDNKKQCGNISWLESKDSDGYCRCDARRNYKRHEVNDMCFYSDIDCYEAPCPEAADGTLQEMLLSKCC